MSLLVTAFGGAYGDLYLTLGGLDGAQHLDWCPVELAVDDVVRAQSIDADVVDEPRGKVPKGASYGDVLKRRLHDVGASVLRTMTSNPGRGLQEFGSAVQKTLAAAAHAAGTRVGLVGEPRRAALRVSVNARTICTAGIPARGNLNISLTWIGKTGRGDEPSRLSIFGLDSGAGCSMRWDAPTIVVGDVVTIEVCACDASDPPSRQTPMRTT